MQVRRSISIIFSLLKCLVLNKNDTDSPNSQPEQQPSEHGESNGEAAVEQSENNNQDQHDAVEHEETSGTPTTKQKKQKKQKKKMGRAKRRFNKNSMEVDNNESVHNIKKWSKEKRVLVKQFSSNLDEVSL